MNSRSLKRRIRVHLGYWVPLLGLGGWHVTVCWSARGAPARRSVAGSCRPQPAICDVQFAFNLRGMAKVGYPDCELEELVVHEVLHAVTIGGSERATNTLAHALVRLRRRSARPWDEET